MSDGNGIEYEDFEIEVSPCLHGDLEVRVLRSPYSRPRGAFKKPYESHEVGPLLSGLEARLLKPNAHLRDVVDEGVELETACGFRPEELGRRLFEALFVEDVRRTFIRSQGGLDVPGPKKGLRVRLSFGSLAASQGAIAALPWEFLFNPDTDEFLALDPRTPVVRYLDAERRTNPHKVTPPLRLLVVMPSPDGWPALDLEKERGLILKALSRTPAIRARFLGRPTTLEELRRSMVDWPPHIIHFMGHGAFRGNDGVLIFEDSGGGADPITGRMLGKQLKEWINSLQLMVLNACRGGAVPGITRQEGQDPFSGVAAALTMAGLPSAIAMQFPISDEVAVEFSSEFYSSLAMLRPVDMAMTDGRLAIHKKCPHSFEWATPVLFMRSRDGKILELAPAEDSPRVRAGILSFEGWGAEIRELEEQSDLLLDLTPFFEGRKLRAGYDWQVDVGSMLRRFAERAVVDGRPHRLEMAAHASIAFVTGYHLEAKGGLDLTIRQRGPRGTEDWHADQGEVPSGELWEVEEQRYDRPGHDVALGIAISRGVEVDVKEYLEKSDLPVGRLLLVSLPKVGNKSILGGAHAFELAEQLARLLEKRTPEERKAVLHLFVSGPNAFVFYLGQLARNFGPTQLYEHGFGAPGAGEYSPSLRLGGES